MTEKELYGVRLTNQRIRELEQHLNLLRSRIHPSTPPLDGQPHAQNLQSKVESLVLQILESTNELEGLKRQMLYLATELTQKICRLVTKPAVRTVLISRYVRCMSFNTITKEMHFSPPTTFRLHREGIRKLIVA